MGEDVLVVALGSFEVVLDEEDLAQAQVDLRSQPGARKTGQQCSVVRCRRLIIAMFLFDVGEIVQAFLRAR